MQNVIKNKNVTLNALEAAEFKTTQKSQND